MNGGHITSREEREFAVAAGKQLGQIAGGSPYSFTFWKEETWLSLG